MESRRVWTSPYAKTYAPIAHSGHRVLSFAWPGQYARVNGTKSIVSTITSASAATNSTVRAP
jgi:hypothetical protein